MAEQNNSFPTISEKIGGQLEKIQIITSFSSLYDLH